MELHSDELTNKNKTLPPMSQCEESGGGNILPSPSRWWCWGTAHFQPSQGQHREQNFLPLCRAASFPPASPTPFDVLGEGFCPEWRRRKCSWYHCCHLVWLWSPCRAQARLALVSSSRQRLLPVWRQPLGCREMETGHWNFTVSRQEPRGL